MNCNLASVPSTMKTKSTRHIRAFRSKNGKMMTSEEFFAFQARKRLFKEANKMMKNNRNINANKKKESRYSNPSNDSIQIPQNSIPLDKRAKLDRVIPNICVSNSTSESGSNQFNEQGEIDEHGLLHNLFISPLPNFIKKVWTSFSGS